MHAWFSWKQAEAAGVRTLKRPDGTTYHLTTVTAALEHGCGWDDMQYLGTIGEDDTDVCSTMSSRENCNHVKNTTLLPLDVGSKEFFKLVLDCESNQKNK